MRALVGILAIACMAALTPCVGAAKSAAPPSTHDKPIVEEEVWVLIDDEPEQHVHRAHESFLQQDLKAAGADIHKSGAFLTLEAGRATDEGKELLRRSGHELATLADRVEHGTVTSVKELNETFARMHHALARHHQLKATELWAHQATYKVGRELNATAMHLEQGFAWTGHKAETGGAEAIRGTRLLAGKLIEGTGWVPAEVGKGIEVAGEAIEKFDKRIAPAKSS